MQFEWDENKNGSNVRKHGISFSQAQRLWEDKDRLEIPVKTTDEPRTLVIGQIFGRMWSAIVTERGHKIHIISVRRSRKKEVNLYEG